ncbi:hypothetical protein [Nitrosophilus labii]|uniref:hypothetical protein n=1 Tax=Nitrosophilus labii TaxID=2706014 RepID=UPI001656DDAB|nr:hypothetical protein [Nitrosophilus labii]
MRLLISFLIIAVISIGINAHASVYKGQKEYMKICKVCHGSGTKVSKAKTTDEWIELFANNASMLKKIHIKDKNAMKYLNSKRFEKKKKHLLDFFKKYAADSGNVPACSD